MAVWISVFFLCSLCVEPNDSCNELLWSTVNVVAANCFSSKLLSIRRILCSVSRSKPYTTWMDTAVVRNTRQLWPENGENRKITNQNNTFNRIDFTVYNQETLFFLFGISVLVEKWPRKNEREKNCISFISHFVYDDGGRLIQYSMWLSALKLEWELYNILFERDKNPMQTQCAIRLHRSQVHIHSSCTKEKPIAHQHNRTPNN